LLQQKVKVEFPECLYFLFKPTRYKVAYGGRGSGKSWGFARALLVQASERPLRVLCTREVQKSIKDSVHRLLCDQIAAMGLGNFFEILETEIRGKNGSSFNFSGLSNQTSESIKSFEGVDVCWCEEAQSISKKSWDTLIPTIRKADSEIWISFNPGMDTDETYLRFVASPPPDAEVHQINYHDNPWFPDVLEKERLHCKMTNAEDYKQIWDGKCRTTIDGAIYADEFGEAVRTGRITNVPYDPKLKVHTVWDLGWNDSMTIILAQKAWAEVRIIDYIEESHKTLDWYVTELQKRRFNWGRDYLPHDGEHKDFKTGRTAADILRAFGRKVSVVPKLPIETGIKAARMAIPMTVFDKEKTTRLQECLKRYRRAINKTTNEPDAPLHDEFSHGADCFRYFSIVADGFSNDDDAVFLYSTPAQTEDY